MSEEQPVSQEATMAGVDETVWDLPTQETPEYLIPRMDHAATSTPVYYKQLVLRDADASADVANDIDEALDPFVALNDLPVPQEHVEGALLTYEQGWYEKGLALGRLLHSTCLAPGEVTQIAITTFERSAAGQFAEGRPARARRLVDRSAQCRA